MSTPTPGPWKIRWYECLADREDVKGGTAKRVGEVLWRVPKQIGPLTADENDWARLHLDVSEEDARLIAAAPDLLEALKLCLCAVELAGWEGDQCAEKARAAIAKATGEQA